MSQPVPATPDNTVPASTGGAKKSSRVFAMLGRLAALAGHRERAIEAYRHYLTLRTDPDPSLRQEADRIRQELIRLQATDVRQ